MTVPLNHVRAGSGRPLLLLHGIGERWQIWAPVLSRLERRREAVAVDFPGFGGSAPLDAGDLPTPPRLASVIGDFADRLGLKEFDVAGISLGGLVALELAASGRARRAVAISPAGLWGPRGAPPYSRLALSMLRRASLQLAPHADAVTRTRTGRTLLGGLNYGRPWQLPAAVLADDIRALARCPGWDPTLAALNHAHFDSGAEVGRATVAWGTRDAILPRRFVDHALLPASTRWLTLPGCGHTPTYDDPALIASVVLEGTL